MEARLPLIEGKTGAQTLSIEAGYRYSDYSTGFSTDTYKAGLDWAPIDMLRFRGSYQHAVRAPNVGELFSTAVRGARRQRRSLRGRRLTDLDVTTAGRVRRSRA